MPKSAGARVVFPYGGKGQLLVMEMNFTFSLPMDEASVPVVRHLCRDALSELGVDENCVADIEVAVTEACSNVLHHANAIGSADHYEVGMNISKYRCDISVRDSGSGFDSTGTGQAISAETAESGRGVFLMRAFVDELDFISDPIGGTLVRLSKTLASREGSPLRLLNLNLAV